MNTPPSICGKCGEISTLCLCEPPASSGTVEGVVGSLSERILRRIFGARYETNRNEDPEMAVAHLMQQYAEIDMQLAAHRYALELQNRAAGLPLDNEAYNKLPELLAEVRACLEEAANDSVSRGVRTAVPWTKCSCETCQRWRKAIGPRTANAEAHGRRGSDVP